MVVVVVRVDYFTALPSASLLGRLTPLLLGLVLPAQHQSAQMAVTALHWVAPQSAAAAGRVALDPATRPMA
jgi:hypothetical protein